MVPANAGTTISDTLRNLVPGTAVSALITAGLAIVVAAAFIAVGWWATRRRTPDLAAITRALAPKGHRRARPLAGDSSFIGREHEQAVFRELLKTQQSGLRVLVVSGSAGMGKTALLERFHDICQEREDVCGPIVDLGENTSIDKLLESLAAGFEEQASDRFRGLRSALERYRAVAAGRASHAEEAVKVGREVADKMPQAVPGLQNAKGVLAVTEVVASQVSKRKDVDSALEELQAAFLSDLADLPDGHRPFTAVLFFADVDRRPGSPAASWLRTWVLPKLKLAPVLVVMSAGTEVDAQLPPGIQSQDMRLQPLSDAESRAFVERRMEVVKPAHVDGIVAQGRGVPQRLEQIRHVYQLRPELRGAESPPLELGAWAGAGNVYEHLQAIPSTFVRRLIVCASPLRWFNAPLLGLVAATAGLAPAEDDQVKVAAELLDLLPPWIESSGGGWGIQAKVRRDMETMLRRRDPDLHRRVHLVAARYHHQRLLRWDGAGAGGQPADSEIDPFVDPSGQSEKDRMHMAEYRQELTEWLYHILVLDPQRAFPIAADKLIVLLWLSRVDHVHQLLEMREELELPGYQRRHLELIAQAAAAYDRAQYGEIGQILDEMLQLGSPTPLSRHAIQAMIGIAKATNGDFQGAGPCLEDGERGLKEIRASVPAAGRLLADCLLWKAWSHYQVSGEREGPSLVLEEGLRLAEELKDPEVRGEVQRVRGLVLQGSGDLDGANHWYRQSLETFREAGLMSQVALALTTRADLLTAQERYSEADRDLIAAATNYALLDDPGSQAEVAVQRMGLYLAWGKARDADEQRQLAIARRGTSAGVHNRIGLAYMRAERWPEAAGAFLEAATIAADTSVFLDNLAEALRRQGIVDPEGSTGLVLDAMGRLPEAAGLGEVLSDIVANLPPALALAAIESWLTDSKRSNAAIELVKARCLARLRRDPPAAATGYVTSQASPAAGALGPTLSPSDDQVKHLEAAVELSHETNTRAAYLCELAEALIQRREWDAAAQRAEEARRLGTSPHRTREIVTRIRLRNALDRAGEESASPCVTAPICLDVSGDLVQWVAPPAADDFYSVMLKEMRARIEGRLGVTIPGITVRDDLRLPPGTARLLINEVPRASFELKAKHLAGATPERCSAVAGGVGEPATKPWNGEPATWVEAGQLAALRAAGIPVWNPLGVMAETLEDLLPRYAGEFVTVQAAAYQARNALDSERLADLVQEMRRRLEAGQIPVDLQAATAALLPAQAESEESEELTTGQTVLS